MFVCVCVRACVRACVRTFVCACVHACLRDLPACVLACVTVRTCPGESLFAMSDLKDSEAGAILLVCSLIIIFLALYGLVKLLNSMLKGSLAKVVKKFINADLPGKAAYFTGYIAILVGAGMTMILQSSSVFTSTLTPMVGVGVVTVERMYPLTLGANIGTTLTGILAALSQDGEHLENALHVALCHLFFNISGILIFYPIPFMRFPIGLAKALGRTTAKHRWFAIMYLILLFVVIPASSSGCRSPAGSTSPPSEARSSSSSSSSSSSTPSRGGGPGACQGS